MPDDPILDEAEPTEPEVTEPTPEPTPTGMSREEVADLLTQTMAPLRESISTMSQLLNQRSAVPEYDDTPDDDDEEAFAAEFYKQPKSVLQREIARLAQPLVAQQADLSGRMLIDQEREKIEKKYGPGTWDEVFSGRLDPVFDHLRQSDPAQLTNRTAVTNAIKTVMGDSIDILVERQKTHTKTTGDATTRERDELRRQLLGEVGNLTGGMRPDRSGATLSEEHKSILADMRRADGRKRDPDKLAAMMSVNTVDEYLAAKKKLNGKAKEA